MVRSSKSLIKGYFSLIQPTRLLAGVTAVVFAYCMSPIANFASGEPFPKRPVPANYKAEVRYTIDAPRDRHVAQFRAMVAKLKEVGFRFNPPLAQLPQTLPEDTTNNTLTGEISSEDMLKVLGIENVSSLLVRPTTFALPANPEDLIQIQLEIPGGLPQQSQLALQDQLRVLLQLFGFTEMVGYDDRGYSQERFTRLRGYIPAGQLDNLNKDLRNQPSGWFAPVILPADLPAPLRLRNPVIITEVIADPQPTQRVAPPAGRADPRFWKIDTNLWNLIAANQPVTSPTRLQIILVADPGRQEKAWLSQIQSKAPSFRFEGTLGNIVTGVFGRPRDDGNGGLTTGPIPIADEVKALAELDIISVLRNPISGDTSVSTNVVFGTNNQKALENSGMTKFHASDAKGQKHRVAILNGSFAGFENAIQQGTLPKDTFLFDLTRERNQSLVPDPSYFPNEKIGQGTQLAQSAAIAAPEAQILLVRIDPSSPEMMETVLRYIEGKQYLSDNLGVRFDELLAQKAALKSRRNEIIAERRVILDNFDDEKELQETYKMLGKLRTWLFTPREWHFQRMAELARDEKDFYEQERELINFTQQVQQLKGVEIIASPLTWNIGFALGAENPISQMLQRYTQMPIPRMLNCNGKCIPAKDKNLPPLWFQSVGNTNGQVWSDEFRDTDGDRVMEFGHAQTTLPEDSWTRELAFLSWTDFAGQKQDLLPANTEFLATMQWREVHDPNYFFLPGGFDYYAAPLAKMQVVILRQRDPSGTKFSQDDFEEVGRSFAFPQRLMNQPNAAVYEMHVTWTTKLAGRYAIRVERAPNTIWRINSDIQKGGLYFESETGLLPTGIRPVGVPTLPELEPHWELRPRIFVSTTAGDAHRQGRLLIRDYATASGAIPVPAAAHALLTVGAADFDGKIRSYTTVGSPSSMALFRAPKLLSFDAIGLSPQDTGPAFGSCRAMAFAAGNAAAMMSSSITQRRLYEALNPKESKDNATPQR